MPSKSPKLETVVTKDTKCQEFLSCVDKQIQSRYYNADPLFRLIGEPNESTVELEGVELTALIDSGSQLTTITESMAKTLELEIHSLKRFLDIEGTGGIQVPYKGYVEAHLRIPEVKKFREDILLLVIDNSPYGKKVPIQVGTLHIDMILAMVTPEELASLGKSWERSSVGRMIQSKQAKIKGKEFTLDDVTGPVKLAEKVTIAPGNTVKIKGITQMKGHSKRVNAITEPLEKGGPIKPISVMTVPTYTMCKPGSNRVSVVLRNMTQEPITLPKGRIVAMLTAANLVPNKLAPRYLSKSASAYARRTPNQMRVSRRMLRRCQTSTTV